MPISKSVEDATHDEHAQVDIQRSAFVTTNMSPVATDAQVELCQKCRISIQVVACRHTAIRIILYFLRHFIAQLQAGLTVEVVRH